SGVGTDNVVIVRGQREIPTLPAGSSNVMTTPDALRREFIQAHRHALTLKNVQQKLRNGATGKVLTDEELLDTLDKASSDDKEGALPLRVHLFHRTLPGLWACADRSCPNRSVELRQGGSWDFGQVYSTERLRCECGAPVFSLLRCEECGD